MRIRSKLAILIAIPLIAVSLAGIYGFARQTAAIGRTEDAAETIRQARLIEQATLAVGSERLSVAMGDTEVEVQQVTDDAIRRMVEEKNLSPLGGSVEELVGKSREASSPVEAISAMSEALGLLRNTADQAASVYQDSETRNGAGANSVALSSLTDTETNWLIYLQFDPKTPPSSADVTGVLNNFVVNRTRGGVALRIAAGGSPNFFASIPTDVGVIELQNLESQVGADLPQGKMDVSNEVAIPALRSHRAAWVEAISDQHDALADRLAGELSSAKNTRTLFSLLGVLGVLVLASFIFVIYRSITKPLESLRNHASFVADEDLPRLVTLLRDESQIDDLPEAELIPVESEDEVGELVEAFNNVQVTAYDLATEQALSRRNVSEMFVNLGRRNQQLLQRILGLITELERTEEDPDRLAELFRLDSIATRMRRNAESLLALAGAQNVRRSSKPISIENTVRSAFGEVEGYQRIDILDLADADISGGSVADVTHLMAELLENALNFSDPRTRVVVNGQLNDDGYQISVKDEGIGMVASELEASNLRITDPPSLDQVPTQFLGLHVVGRLADRHGIKVRLVEGELAGLVAKIQLPTAILGQQEDEAGPSDSTETTAESETNKSDDIEFDKSEFDGLDDPSEPDDVSEGDDVEGDDARTRHAGAGNVGARVSGDGVNRSDDKSPLNEVHDLEADLAELNEADAVAAGGVERGASTELTTRTRSAPTSSTPLVQRPVTISEADKRSKDKAETSQIPDPTTDKSLPVRTRGESLGQGAAFVTPKNSKSTDSESVESAHGFSSMLSAFSSGVSEATSKQSKKKGDE